MKKYIFAISVLLASSSAFSAVQAPLAEVIFKDSSKLHKYTLIKEGKTPVFKLVFQVNQQKPKTRTLSQSQADSIRNDMTRIIWTTLSRKPASTQKCHRYVSMSSGTDKADVCMENRKVTGMTYGLLNSMSQLFR